MNGVNLAWHGAGEKSTDGNEKKFNNICVTEKKMT